MYLPKSKYRVKNPPPGTFETEGGTKHNGSVVVLDTGEVFAGSSISRLGSKLVDPTLEKTLVEIPQPFNDYIEPTPDQYSNGKFTRYLLRNEITKRVVETSEKQFEQKKNLPNIQPIEVQWFITGEIEDRTLPGNITVKGIKTINLQTVERLSKEFAGIELFLSNPLKYVQV